MKKLIYILPLFLLLSGVFNSCKKDKDDEAEGVSVLSLRMTDAPANYDAVLIDIQTVEITGDGGNFINLNVNSGIYNLLDFTNGVDTLIAMGSIPSGKIQQIRLILGNNNSIVVDGLTYPLSTPSAQQSGLKLQVHETFLPGVAYMLLLDFDAQQSIVEQGNGTYSLKPVIRVVESALSGSITGIVNPPTEICAITAEANGIQYSTYSNVTGSFLLMGIPQGVYTVAVTPGPPMLPVIINNVAVTTGNLTNMGIVDL